jgi:hypothetical protein
MEWSRWKEQWGYDFNEVGSRSFITWIRVGDHCDIILGYKWIISVTNIKLSLSWALLLPTLEHATFLTLYSYYVSSYEYVSCCWYGLHIRQYSVPMHSFVSLLQSSTHKCDDVTSSFQFGSSGKAYPIPGHEGPEGEYKYSPTLSLTSVLNRGGWSKPRPGSVPIVHEAGWAPEPVCTGAEKISSRIGMRPPDRPARSESRYTEYAIPAHSDTKSRLTRPESTAVPLGEPQSSIKWKI